MWMTAIWNKISWTSGIPLLLQTAKNKVFLSLQTVFISYHPSVVKYKQTKTGWIIHAWQPSLGKFFFSQCTGEKETLWPLLLPLRLPVQFKRSSVRDALSSSWHLMTLHYSVSRRIFTTLCENQSLFELIEWWWVSSLSCKCFGGYYHLTLV